ncbi:ABC transporter ATP-binding protein [Clostridium sp. MSJ-8]|uniref:ATP-binding cassette domain-containing protein n=1 Tax=Clostridium sp. MSJ-8 TaxID=2841510 RepID=UPI001C0F3841|nr:ABC transporter ATP-binding protein [Clostridium sp. MSJ-8]MBU5487316.1 ABC transporter ATP-binding protein [Clostridium sp. MSJ-8]
MKINDEIIKIENLEVKFNDTKVLDINENIVINEGDIVGIIGANGAGKSTLINSIINQVKYNGKIECKFSKDELGIQFQDNSYNKIMKVYELIQIVTNKKKFDCEIKKLFDEFDLNKILKKRIGKLSGGEKQRLTLFLVLYLKPKIMIFDELTTGLDFQKRNKLLKIVKNYSEGRTVLTISHYFEELTGWANKVLILDKGKIVFYGTIEELKNRYNHRAIYKIKKVYRNEIKNLYKDNKHIKIIENFNDEIDALVLIDSVEQQNLVQELMNRNISYEMELCNLYSLYTLAISQMKGSE